MNHRNFALSAKHLKVPVMYLDNWKKCEKHSIMGNVVGAMSVKGISQWNGGSGNLNSRFLK